MASTQKIVTNLWFDTEGEDAAKFYIEVFTGRPGGEKGESKIVAVSHYLDAGPREKGMVLTVDFLLEGQRFTALNGGPEFTFSEAMSLLVNCESQDEVDYFWEQLAGGGGEHGPCGWLKDRFGLSWQIVPAVLDELIMNEDERKANAAFKAMLKMGKIEIEELQRAFDAA